MVINRDFLKREANIIDNYIHSNISILKWNSELSKSNIFIKCYICLNDTKLDNEYFNKTDIYDTKYLCWKCHNHINRLYDLKK